MGTQGEHLTSTHLLPYPAEGVEVVYTTNPIEVEAWLRNNVIDCSAQAVGFDIEWKPQFKSKKDGGVENKTAVLQLAIESSSLVFQLYNLEIPPNVLVSVLKDERILKVGSGILQDVKKLNKDTGLNCIGLVDTQKLAKEVGVSKSKRLGLKALAKCLLGIELAKPNSVTRSNWENFPLTVKQIHYAALDAWIGLKIYQSMKAMQGKSTCKSLEGSGLVNCEEAAMNENPPPCHACGTHDLETHDLELTTHDLEPKTHDLGPTTQDQQTLPKLTDIPPTDDRSKIYQSMKAMQGKSTCKSLEGSSLVNCEEAAMNENPPPCHVCGKKVKTSSALSKHLKVHPKCQCGQYFVGKIGKKHMKECPLLNSLCCHVCGKKVMTSSALSEHLKVHPKCPCGQYFAEKISKEHRMKCSKLNQWAESILKHIKINSDEPGLCNACGKKCEALESLISHIREAGHVLCPFCTDLLPCDTSHSHILKCQDLTGE
ncbi:PREDICTED: zinc finger protein 2-like isoform X1 [Acropora digitifera]|uniref:zinc finger protein 2-like isoform X1 n=1 Tax=Acropora digitifera TaxID=70779 RepID=UPI00077A9BF3|nr:PREDICTED: zinc finger protein 2-like isoform X1 [Acropora digitifera]